MTFTVAHPTGNTLTLTLMILLWKLFSTTITSPASAGESVPSCLKKWIESEKMLIVTESFNTFFYLSNNLQLTDIHVKNLDFNVETDIHSSAVISQVSVRQINKRV